MMIETLIKVIALTGFLLTAGCSSTTEDSKNWEPQLDQHFLDSMGFLTFGRTHYVVTKNEAMNTMRTNQVKAFMKKTCKEKKLSIIRSYLTESDFVSLRGNYPRNIQIKVFEFNCR
ncbi:MAG: hypothetical protein K9K67_03335 [Bacteriovoracaceae bacterium]|nr:hypothetical protein [Bacteriovoracaceae bacterium]